MKRQKTFFGVYVFILVITILAYQLPVPVNANESMSPSEGLLPAQFESQLSEDGNTLYSGAPPKAVVKDPNPPPKPRRILAPAWMKALPEGVATATFEIEYIPNGGKDKWGERCYTFPEDAKTAFEAAARIWGNILKSSVPITIKACWASLVGADADTLGYSGGGPWKKNFPSAPRKDTFYAGSLANALQGYDLDTDAFDMHITYNKTVDWYYGTDGNMPTCPSAISNGNFESGAVSWTQSPSNDRIDQWREVPSHSGTWYTWLGQANPEEAYIEQTVTVPSSCPQLIFYHWIASDENYCNWDYAYVEVSDNGTDWDVVETINLCNTNDTNGWVRKSIDLSSYENQEGKLRFRIDTDYTNISSWYIDTIFFQADKYDLMTVVLHEIAHGLNFYDSMRYSNGLGAWGDGSATADPNIYDVFLKDGTGKSLITYVNNSSSLGNALTSENLWFHGAGAMAANGGLRVRMYAPYQWSSGSSIAHLDYETFDNTTNELMVYAFAPGEVVHYPGPIAKALLKDLGWPTRTSDALPFILPLLLD